MPEEESALTSAEAAAILANISSGRVLRISNTSALFLQKQEMFLKQINFVETLAPAQHYIIDDYIYIQKEVRKTRDVDPGARYLCINGV